MTAEAGIVGTTISGRYRIDKLLGEGGMGAVYQAEHTLMHKRVAVKVLHAEMSHMSEVVARFEREAMAAAHIEHPNVASATDFGKLDNGDFFLVLEFVEGRSLREAITKGPIPLAAVVHIAKQIASALSRAHSLGIVHRDLKPENIMLVEKEGDAYFVKVLDFGIAKVPVGDIAPASRSGGHNLTQAGMIYGTPEYMPPEQALGEEVDARADTYALGIMLYEMLAGVRPFDDESRVKLLGMHITAPVPPLSQRGVAIPPELETLIMRMLAKEAKDRPQDTKEVADTLDLVTGSLASSPMLPVLPEPRISATSVPILPSTPSLVSIQTASHPTVLALGPQVRSFVADVRRTVPPPLLYALLGLVGAIVLIIVFWGVTRVATGSPDAAASASGFAKVEQNAPRFGEEIKAVSHRAQFMGQLEKGDIKKALAEADAWLAADPTAQNDTQVQATVKAATARSEDADAAFALLETGRMGAAGADILYDLAYGGGTGATTTRAKRALAKNDVQRNASPTLSVTLDLRNAKDCNDKKVLLEAAANSGDARTLTVLESYVAKGGCGFLGTRDCWACMRKDGLLDQTLSKLRSRVGP